MSTELVQPETPIEEVAEKIDHPQNDDHTDKPHRTTATTSGHITPPSAAPPGSAVQFSCAVWLRILIRR